MGESLTREGNMARQPRFKTSYPGVYYVKSTIPGSKKPDKIYYIRYRRQGKLIEEKAGRQSTDDMTPARASSKRTERLAGNQLSNLENRKVEQAAKDAEKNKWTITRLWEQYKEGKTVNKSLEVDDSRFHNYIKPFLGNKTPQELQPLDLDRIRIKLLKKKGLSPQTVKHILGVVKRACNFGFNKGLTPALSFRIEMPEVDNKVTEDLTADELNRLLAAIDADNNIHVGNMMRLALFSGLRRGELFKLKWSDIDFNRGFIDVIDPKGKVSQKIPLNAATRDVLMNHERTDSPYVFPGKDGGPRASVQKASRRIRERAGLPKSFRPLHGLRHTFASMIASSGKVDMYTLQKLMTHKSPVMTQRYAHLRDEALKKASDTTDDIIQQAINGKDNVINLKE